MDFLKLLADSLRGFVSQWGFVIEIFGIAVFLNDAWRRTFRRRKPEPVRQPPLRAKPLAVQLKLGRPRLS